MSLNVLVFESLHAVHFLKLVAEPELRYRYATRVAEWEVPRGSCSNGFDCVSFRTHCLKVTCRLL
jgi:hypothetical protein